MFQELATALLMQIALAFPQYEVPAEIPPIHIVNKSIIQRACGEKVSACIGETRSGHFHIFLPTDQTEAEYEALLGHELVHYVQWSNGRQHHQHFFNVLEHALEREAEHFEVMVKEAAKGKGLLADARDPQAG